MSAHMHRHDDVVLCDRDHGWPDWVDALMATAYHLQGELMAQQDQINADVQLLQDALTGIGAELQDYRAALAAQAPQLDLSGLDAIAAKAQSLVPPTAAPAAPTDTPAAPAAPADAPVVSPDVPVAPAADAGAPIVSTDGSVLPTDTGTVQGNVDM